MRGLALVLLFGSLPLGAAAVEIATALAAAAALVAAARLPRARVAPLAGPAAAVAAAWLLAAAGRGGAQLVEALGRAWVLAPALAIPPLLAGLPERWLRRAEGAGLLVAALVGCAAVAEFAWTGQARGPFSHHLTLGYALVVPLARAAAAREPVAVLAILAGVVGAGATGPLVAAAVALAGATWRPGLALALGLAGSLAGLAWLAPAGEVHERALLWHTGELLAVRPLGVGPAGFRAAAAAIQPGLADGFYYPLHAHDAALQVAALAGLGAWVAWAWLLAVLWRRADRAGRAALAAILVGGLTQDTLGDLEVARALLAWSLLPALRPRR